MAAGTIRNVFLNGKQVGTIVSSGDDATDALACQELLKQLGLYRETNRVDRLFGQACSFSAAARLLYHQLNRNNADIAKFGAPFVVNMAFSVELYLKALSELYGPKLTGHDLAKLYQQLPKQAKRALEDLAPEASRIVQIQSVPSFKEVLAGVRNAFIDWRYNYEREGLSDMFPIGQSRRCMLRAYRLSSWSTACFWNRRRTAR